MNRDEIARIYEKANGWSPAEYPTTMADLERFAALVEQDFKNAWPIRLSSCPSVTRLRVLQLT